MAQFQQVSMKALIERDGKYFLVRDPKKKWEMPGGRIDFGEDPKQTLRREMQEELGVEKMDIHDLVNIWTFLYSDEDGEFQFILAVYHCDAELDKITISEEHLESAWVLYDEISDLLMRDGYKESIRMYHEKKYNS